VKRISSFLIVAALIAGTVGCVSSPTQYDLTISSTEGGEITTHGEGTFAYDEGEVVNLVAEAEEGYQFVNWTGNVGTIANTNAASTTVTMNDSYSIAANFEAIPASQYSLTISSTASGLVTMPGEGTFAYDEGEVVNLVAEAKEGYQFVNWTGDVDDIANVEDATTAITMTDDYSIAANFVKQQYDLTTSSTASGLVTMPGEGTFTYDEGEVVNLVTEAEEGYQFVNWTGDVDSIDNVEAASTTITMNGDYSVTANFERIPVTYYTLAIAVSGSGLTNRVVEQHTYAAGTVVLIIATPPCGYRFVNWTGDVDTIADVNSSRTTITMNGDYFIIANFSKIPVTYYALTMAVNGSGLTSPTVGQHTYAAGTVVSISATPASGYRFVNWTGNVDTVGNVNTATTTITVNGDYSIKANFEQISTEQFGLTTSSTTGGSVTVPGEGTFTYDAGMVVSLMATPGAGYQFVGWTGDVGTIANVNAASTTITMNDSYSIRANFSEGSPSPPGISYTEADVEQLIIVLVNAERQQFGLPTLSEDPLLTSLAKDHSISMVENNFFSHDRYPGERSFSYGQLPGTIRGENIVMIPTRRVVPGPYLSLQEVCEWAVSLWMSSSGHRANILEPRYTKTGVGVSFSEGGEYLYITQMFEGYY
jgi:uncharacterized repeat protein (TIGR02543 family)